MNPKIERTRYLDLLDKGFVPIGTQLSAYCYLSPCFELCVKTTLFIGTITLANRNGMYCLYIHSVTLDTPMNRKLMPDADQTTWTPLEFVAG